jgi:hypothetical protein
MKGWFLFVAMSIAILTGLWCGAFLALEARAQSADPRELPTRRIPVPDTVSPQLQKMIAVPVLPIGVISPRLPRSGKGRLMLQLRRPFRLFPRCANNYASRPRQLPLMAYLPSL